MSDYDTLEISRQASPADIKAAYRRLATVHHPDRNPGDSDAPRRFRAIQNAHERLSNPERKRQYDLYLENEKSLLEEQARRAGEGQARRAGEGQARRASGSSTTNAKAQPTNARRTTTRWRKALLSLGAGFLALILLGYVGLVLLIVGWLMVSAIRRGRGDAIAFLVVGVVGLGLFSLLWHWWVTADCQSLADGCAYHGSHPWPWAGWVTSSQ